MSLTPPRYEVLLVLLALHLAAIVFYRIWKRENLVKPMISGWKWVRVESSESPENSTEVDLK
jgi:cytochrome b